MTAAAATAPTPFAKHHLTEAERSSWLAERLRGCGLATVSGLPTRGTVLGFVHSVMRLTPHRDSDRDGLTTIHNTSLPHRAPLPGFAGFGNGELAPHTERSSIPRPPRLMLLVCLRPALEGGECGLIDGQAVLADLDAHHPEIAEELAVPRSAYFGDGGGHLAQVITHLGPDRASLRLRLDELVKFSPHLTPHLPVLRAVLDRHRTNLTLSVGQGYLLDNHRWLHSRGPFTGERLMVRALGDPIPAMALRPGFIRAAAHTGEQREPKCS
ncbi:TauD/TfdA family dioxygenase [Streptomyces fildesensis]|uniref:TauD/TfdA family dioxygenase n=1 Tax=Streptomyces fildesensis TaxID=375757 RepID=UPI0018E0585B|nr:TauD/TfdA family dioxygenase [Streptomyces fildesensis]